MMRFGWLCVRLAPVALIAVLTACGGGGKQGGESAAQQGGGAVPDNSGGTPAPTAQSDCTGSCATDNPQNLTVADVQQIIAQAVSEAQAQGVEATIAVTDRVGNVLAVFQMSGANPFIRATTSADGSPTILGGLENVNIIPATIAAISKAITGAYLTSEGNAFTSRTASQIVQEHFNPGEGNTPSGPLFGVQFSQLPCSDFVQRFDPNNPGVGPGPHRSPLGLSADPGGLPLYKAGTPVGGIGVIADGIYGIDRNIMGFDFDVDELVATAGTVGFAAPVARRADVITIIGKTARFSDSFVEDLMSTPADAPAFATIAGSVGNLVPVPGYHDGNAVLAGTAFGQPASGIRAVADNEIVDSAGNNDLFDQDAFIFVDAANANRHPPRAGLDTPGGSAANALTADEVTALLFEAIGVANSGRAQIRQPNGSRIAVTVSVVDTSGNILGMARTRDAPIFGADVSLQKARTAAFYSGTGRVGGIAPADALRGVPDPLYLGEQTINGIVADTITPTQAATVMGGADVVDDLKVVDAPKPSIIGYVTRPGNDPSGQRPGVQAFLGIPRALEADGPPAAFADRSGGNLSRPTYPDGPDGSMSGPFSKSRALNEWSVFSTGLQLDLVYNAVINHVAFVALRTVDPGFAFNDVGDTDGDGLPEMFNCTGNTGLDLVNAGNLFATQNPIAGNPTDGTGGLANGIQIFPGSVPIYRGDVLIGGIGVSGDGVDQDDMVSFLGLYRAGLSTGTINHAPMEIRADTITPDPAVAGSSERLRYVNCPQAPFLNSDEDDVCDGL